MSIRGSPKKWFPNYDEGDAEVMPRIGVIETSNNGQAANHTVSGQTVVEKFPEDTKKNNSVLSAGMFKKSVCMNVRLENQQRPIAYVIFILDLNGTTIHLEYHVFFVLILYFSY